MGETRVDLLRLLEDLKEAYPGSVEEFVTEFLALWGKVGRDGR